MYLYKFIGGQLSDSIPTLQKKIQKTETNKNQR